MSLSNIIKGGRIRNQGYLDLSLRHPVEVEMVYDELAHAGEMASAIEEHEVVAEREAKLAQLEQEIQERLAAANQQAEVIITEAMARGQAIEKDAQDKHEAILAEAYGKQEKIIQSYQTEAESITRAAYDEKQQMLEAVEGEVVETMIEILKHLISEEVNGHVEWLRLVVKKMMFEDRTSEQFELLVSSNNLRLIEADEKNFRSELTKLAEIKVDETLNDTTCILKTEQGCIEYDLTKGLEKVISELRILKGIS